MRRVIVNLAIFLPIRHEMVSIDQVSEVVEVGIVLQQRLGNPKGKADLAMDQLRDGFFLVE